MKPEGETEEAATAQPEARESRLDPALYSAAEAFEREQETVFERAWIYVGLRDELARHQDFITKQIGRHSVVVQNFNGELRALHNVCSHRFARIQRAQCGNRPLSCPYHGWTYDADGVPLGIPGNKDFFGFDRAGKQARALRRFALEACGRFVFVRVADEGPDLKTFLGAYHDLLEHLSETFGGEFAAGTLPWAANWKIGVESVLEVYHVRAVHPETFQPFTKDDWICSYEADHSSGLTYLSDSSQRWWDGVARRLKLAPSQRLRDYDHFFIFPNLAIGLTNGALMSVQTYEPKSAESCSLAFKLYLADRNQAADREAAIFRAATASLAEFNLQVLDEDREIAETVQIGSRQVGRRAVYGANEGRIMHFHRAYLDRLDAGTPRASVP